MLAVNDQQPDPQANDATHLGDHGPPFLPNWECLIGCGALMSTPKNRVRNIPKVWIRIVRRRAGVVAFPRKGSILLLLGRDRRRKTIDSFQKPPSSPHTIAYSFAFHTHPAAPLTPSIRHARSSSSHLRPSIFRLRLVVIIDRPLRHRIYRRLSCILFLVSSWSRSASRRSG
jgi:hypothetical protein